MYYERFGLSGAPFEFNPSASVLFMSAGHREGLAALEWGLREPSGFTMLVGEIGAGKTTLIYSLLAARHQGVRSAWVANPRLSFGEMLRQILGQLGVNQPDTSDKLALLQAFDAQLASLGPDECIAVIIDEAQDLSDDALEDLRLLSNFQSLERRRLQIVLVGQIELARRLSAPNMRQLNQRIGARALLPVLQGKEIYAYVEYRLRSRGGDIERLFTSRRNPGTDALEWRHSAANQRALPQRPDARVRGGRRECGGATCTRRRSRLRPPAREQRFGAGENGGVGERGDQIGVGAVRARCGEAGGLAQAACASRGGGRSARGDVSAGDRRCGNYRSAPLSRDSNGAVCAIRIARQAPATANFCARVSSAIQSPNC